MEDYNICIDIYLPTIKASSLEEAFDIALHLFLERAERNDSTVIIHDCETQEELVIE